MTIVQETSRLTADEADERKICLTVRTVAGVVGEIHVPEEATIEALSEAVEQTLGIPSWSQRFIHAGVAFDNEALTLEQAGVTEGSVLDIVQQTPSLLKTTHWENMSPGSQSSHVFKLPVHMKVVSKKCIIRNHQRSVIEVKAVKGDQASFSFHHISDVFQDLLDARKVLIELRILQHFNNDSVLRMTDLLPPLDVDFKDVNFMTEHMPTNLQRVLHSKQPLSNDHYRFFFWQLLLGLRCLHSAKVVHTDLKPDQLLLNEQCALKISGFESAQALGTIRDRSQEHVVTRWYQAPEQSLGPEVCLESWDLWASGCILGEMLGRKPVFLGTDCIDQLKKISELIGCPSADDFADASFAQNPQARNFLRIKLTETSQIDWTSKYPDATPGLHKCLKGLLHWRPAMRERVDAMLLYECFADLPDNDDEAEEPPELFDWALVEVGESKSAVHAAIYKQCASFRPDLLKRDQEQLVAMGICLE